MALRKIGEATTNSDGIATITYTGTGAGKVDLKAQYYEEDTESMIQSETYELIDGTFLDRAVTNQKNTNWMNALGEDTVVTDDTGTTLTNEKSSTLHYWANNYTKFDIGTFAIEFDLIEYTDSTSPSVRLLGTNSHQIVFKTIGCPQNCHLKIIVDGTGIKYQIDNGNIVDFVTTTDTSFQLGFRFAGDCSVKYRNFVVYPI